MPTPPISPEDLKILEAFQENALKEIDCGVFKAFYKPMTVHEEILWGPEYTQEVNGHSKIDSSELFKSKIFHNLDIKIPKAVIQHLTGLEKEWRDLTRDQRYDLLFKEHKQDGKVRVLDPTISKKIISSIAEADNGSAEQKKT